MSEKMTTSYPRNCGRWLLYEQIEKIPRVPEQMTFCQALPANLPIENSQAGESAGSQGKQIAIPSFPYDTLHGSGI